MELASIRNIFSSVIKVLDDTLGKKIEFSFLIIILGFIAYKVAIKVFTKFLKKLGKTKFMDEQETKTLITVGQSFITIIVIFVVLISVLEQFVTMASLGLATFGGVIIAVMSQSIIKDIFSGVIILIEKQFHVGDYISVDSYSGVVKELSLRYTELEDYNGDVHIISNSSIARITNHSVNPLRFIVYTSLYNNRTENEVINALTEICDNLKKEDDNIVGDFAISISENMSNFTTYKIMGFAKNLKSVTIQNKLNKMIKQEFENMYIKTDNEIK